MYNAGNDFMGQLTIDVKSLEDRRVDGVGLGRRISDGVVASAAIPPYARRRDAYAPRRVSIGPERYTTQATTSWAN